MAKIYRSLTDPIIVLGVNFWWLAVEGGVCMFLVIWLNLPFVGLASLVGLHIFGYYMTKRDPNFMIVWHIWIKHFSRPIKRRFKP